ncbi:porin [Vibrio sinaloensis]|uniref:porin n=1 Tax=Photobacterium sp. (strain ATCC 43367) TaxID=379097 RepID=UPI0020705BF3|nr:porin [Vibrio sinaloensis]UPQ88626.1 porin [Vibrio sinaloensis]
MDKMFKRTLLGAAVATAAMSGSANAAVELAGDAVQFYGQAAGFMIVADNNVDETTSAGGVIESRIGFRGTVEFEDFGPDLVWQIEGGNADNSAKSGQLGARDTYLGLSFANGNTFKFGRQLVAAYNYVDWPHTNPGLGGVFDWHNDIGASYQDRADNVFRFDSASFNGFNFQATLSGMEQETERMVASLGTSYTTDMFSLHAGYYQQKAHSKGVDEPTKWIVDQNTGTVAINPDWTAWSNGGSAKFETVDKQSYTIVGGSFFLGNTTLTAGYKMMKFGAAKQNAFSATAQHVIDGTWVLKAGYAATDDATAKDGSKMENSADKAVTARLGYLLPSAYLYIDSRNSKVSHKDNKWNNKDWTHQILVGAEYYF